MNLQRHHIRVWAPNASLVELRTEGHTSAMIPDPERQQLWISETLLPVGARYGFTLDGEGPFPDPRSPSQPDGVHGLSELLDLSSYPWQDAEWVPPAWESAVIYELHVGTFSQEGTFDGVIPHLDALLRLGVTHVELMPVNEFPGTRGWGYDSVSIYAVHRSYGGASGLMRLVDACHAAGLAVILDVVYNHAGPDGNYLMNFGPYFSPKHMTPWGEGPNLDDENCEEVRRFFIDNAMMWLHDFHIDGLRLDAIDKVKDDSSLHFLAQLRAEVDALAIRSAHPRILIAETASNDPVFVLPVDAGGYGMDAQWNDDLHHAIHSHLTGESETYYVDFGSLEHWEKALRNGFVYDGCHSLFRGRSHGKPAEMLPGHTFLAYLQTHDQVGNRAMGDRFHHHPQAGINQQKLAAAFVLLSPYIPMIFMGEEWAASTPFLYFTDHENADLGLAVSEGRKREFGGSNWGADVPDPQSIDTFNRSKLRWEERSEGDHAAMLGWYSELLRLRKGSHDFSTAKRREMEVRSDPKEGWLWMKRGAHIVAAAVTDSLVQTPFTAPADSLVLLQAGAPQISKTGHLVFHGISVIIYKESHE